MPLSSRAPDVKISKVSRRVRNVSARIETWNDAWLAIRILGWACCLPILKRVVPLRTLVRLLRHSPTSAIRMNDREEQIATFARWSCRATAWSSGGNCLERGLIMYRFLGRANAQPSLAIGFARGPAGKLLGHAWVIVDGRPVGETLESLSEFHTALTFSSDGRTVERGEPLLESA